MAEKVGGTKNARGMNLSESETKQWHIHSIILSTIIHSFQPPPPRLLILYYIIIEIINYLFIFFFIIIIIYIIYINIL